MNKLRFHILFWIFISLYVFDYFIDAYNLKQSIGYTLFETTIYSAEFYINLNILLPLVLKNKGRVFYFVSVLLVLTLFCSFYFLVGFNEDLLSPFFLRSISSFLLNHSLFFLISYFVWYFNRFQDEQKKRLQLENEKLQSELMLLKSQISPHFLFNALNNIYSLSLLKSDDAPKMLSSLSDILRYFLYEGGKQSVFLESEIEIISKYIQIQKYRQIPGMSNITLTVLGNAASKRVPPLLFMTLIENAFKHGDIVELKEGFVTIFFEISEKKIEFEISNSCTPKEKSNGIGLKNIKAQLDILLANNYQMIVEEKNNSYKVHLTINGN